MPRKPSFLLLFLLISFGSITAVAFTPALPDISLFFTVSTKTAALTIILFLVGYTIGQLLYGPLANRFGRKMALYFGISLEIIASLLCVLAASLHAFWLLILARFLMALGASGGLKMSFTLVADTCTESESRKIIAHLMMAFAVTPALGVAIGGFLAEHFFWTSVFYFMAGYGVLLLLLTLHTQETAKILDPDALKWQKIIRKYAATLTRPELPLSALLMGLGTAVVYLFASLAPFIAMEFMGLNPSRYGLWNLLPSLGVITGSQLAAHLHHKLSAMQAIFIGAVIMLSGALVMFCAFASKHFEAEFLFIPLLIMYVGMGFVYANASGIATARFDDKSNASAMMSFINMGVATICVLLLNFIPNHSIMILPVIYCILTGALLVFALMLQLCIGSRSKILSKGTKTSQEPKHRR